MLIFDEKEHIYTEDGKRLPSVTDIVNDECGNPGYATEWHLNRGTQVHRCMALYLAERLDLESVDPRIRARVDQGIKAVKDLQIHPRAIEHRMSHKTLGFAGTPDLLAEMQGKPRDCGVDWKSSHARETEIQVGGYTALYEDQGYNLRAYFEIVLEDDTYRVYEYQPRRSRGLFLAALSLYKWRKNGKV